MCCNYSFVVQLCLVYSWLIEGTFKIARTKITRKFVIFTEVEKACRWKCVLITIIVNFRLPLCKNEDEWKNKTSSSTKNCFFHAGLQLKSIISWGRAFAVKSRQVYNDVALWHISQFNFNFRFLFRFGSLLGRKIYMYFRLPWKVWNIWNQSQCKICNFRRPIASRS